MGMLAVDVGDLAWARELFEQALAGARASGAKEMVARSLFGLAELAQGEDEAGRAAVLYKEALELRRQVGSVPPILDTLEAVAGLYARTGLCRRSAALLGAAQAVRVADGYSPTAWRSRHQADAALLREALGTDAFDAAVGDGAALSLEEAMTLALDRRPPPEALGSRWATLTERELHVAALVAEGLSNREIAERLLVSLSTVKVALSQLFSKLGVKRRTELAREFARREREVSLLG
jgi:DNA-binding CsgD family transcriptional regulator